MLNAHPSTQRITPGLLWALVIALILGIGFACFGQDVPPFPGAPAAEPAAEGKFGFAQLVALVGALVIIARVIVKITPTPKDDTWLATVVEWLKHLGLVIKVLVVACVLSFAATATAQTNQPPPVLLSTNSIPVRLFDFTQGMSGTSNLNFEVYPSYAPDLINADGKSDQWGFGAAITYSFRGDVGQYLFAGLRLDYLGSEFWAPSIAGGLKADVQIAGHNFTPFAYTGAIVPLSGAGAQDGEWGVIYGAGLKTDVWRGKLFGKDARVGIGAAVERWDNFDGPVYHIAPVLSIKW